MVNKLKWCFSKKEVKLIEPNENLAREYIKSAEETLVVIFACYALLMRLGIKSEIHDCTIEILKFLEKENIIDKRTAKILEKDKELRIDNQYYLKNREVVVEYEKLRDLILKIKEIINTITNKQIEEIRMKIERFVKF